MTEVSKDVKDAVHKAGQTADNITSNAQKVAQESLDNVRSVYKQAAEQAGEWGEGAKTAVKRIAKTCQDDFSRSSLSSKVAVGVLAGLAAFGVAHFVLTQLFSNDE